MARSPKGGHELTRDDSRRGGLARAAKLEAERAEQRRLAVDRAANLVHRALDRVKDTLDGGDPRLALAAARDILDRVLGKTLADGVGTESVVEIRWAFDPRPDGSDDVVESKPQVSEKRPSRKRPARRVTPKPDPEPAPERSEDSPKPDAAMREREERRRIEEACRRDRRRSGSGLADAQF